jgi:uncharacterized iron-regulated membrane protein
MKEGFRQSMAWLHTWSGLLVGWVLFLVFAGGTASYFKDEISVWMRPELHTAGQALPEQALSAERGIAALHERAPTSQRWFLSLPTEREPGMRATWMPPPEPKKDKAQAAPKRSRFENVTLDPSTGLPMAAVRETRGGEFLYRLHFDLHYMPAVWARWIVGFCAMFMLVAILSGIVTHRRIFADFFTFRPKKGQRSWLDAHNATAVLALPYHLMITYTGLITLMFMYMPWGPQVVYKGNQDAFFADVFPGNGVRDPKAAGQPVPLAAIGPMVAQASAHWGGAPVGRITVNNPNDANATVSLQRQDGRVISSSQPGVLFNGATGQLIARSGDEEGAAVQTRGVLYGLHIGRFANPLLRGLFFLCGLAGCAMVATGLLLWAVKERQKYAKALAHGGRVGWGLRAVDGLNIGAVAGVPIAIAAYFWANRLLPVGLAGRPQAEISWFFVAWGAATLAGLAWPTKRMWQAQLGIGGALFAGVPLLNAVTTTTHLGVSVTLHQWVFVGFDLTCLGLGLFLLTSAWWLYKRKPLASKRGAPPRPVVEAIAPAGSVAS